MPQTACVTCCFTKTHWASVLSKIGLWFNLRFQFWSTGSSQLSFSGCLYNTAFKCSWNMSQPRNPEQELMHLPWHKVDICHLRSKLLPRKVPVQSLPKLLNSKGTFTLKFPGYLGLPWCISPEVSHPGQGQTCLCAQVQSRCRSFISLFSKSPEGPDLVSVLTKCLTHTSRIRLPTRS